MKILYIIYQVCFALPILLVLTILTALTGYSGYDPEVSIREGALTPGLDFSAYPRAYSISFGVNLGF